jgi:hypothetical protein
METERVDPGAGSRWVEESSAIREVYERRLRMAAEEEEAEGGHGPFRRLTLGLLGLLGRSG